MQRSYTQNGTRVGIVARPLRVVSYWRKVLAKSTVGKHPCILLHRFSIVQQAKRGVLRYEYTDVECLLVCLAKFLLVQLMRLEFAQILMNCIQG